jgi:hypothetical protein
MAMHHRIDFLNTQFLGVSWGSCSRTLGDNQKRAKHSGFLFMPALVTKEVSGLGVINYFFQIDYSRTLSLIILLPTYIALTKKSGHIPIGKHPTDWFFLGYVLLQCLLLLDFNTFTNVLRRGVFYGILDILLPYLVMSRFPLSFEKIKEVLAIFAVTGCFIALVALFEYARGWLVYYNVRTMLDAGYAYGNYLGRGEDLRAQASTGQPIVLGFVLVLSAGAGLGMAALSNKKFFWYLLVLINICGMYASLSRGPFVGFVAMAVVMIFVSRDPMKNLMAVGISSVLLIAGLLASPFRDKFIGLIPFLGEVDDFNVTYRQQLLNLGYEILSRNPFLGASDFFYSLEDLRNGEGIIDIVNSYLAVALSSGLIGLTLFCGCIFIPLYLLLKELRKRPSLPYEQRVIVITVIALTVASSIIIFTVSSILTIPLVYWSLAGLSIQICQAIYRETRPNAKAKIRHKNLAFS